VVADPSRLQHQSQIITQISTEICATVPQHADYLPQLQYQSMKSGYSPSEGFTKLKMAKHVTGIYSPLYPLFAVGAMGITPTQQKEWTINHMEYLGRMPGISLAFATVAMLKEGKSLGP
jgi:hypothetical protein